MRLSLPFAAAEVVFLKCGTAKFQFFSSRVRILIIWVRQAAVSRDGILGRHFLSRFQGINSNLLRLKFLCGFLPSFYRSAFADFLVRITKTRVEYGFL
jgi:hypothetical protein